MLMRLSGLLTFACFWCYTDTSHVVDTLPSDLPPPECLTISTNQHKDIPANNSFNTIPSTGIPLSHTLINKTTSLPTEMSAQSITSSLDSVLYADTQIFIPNITFGKVVKVYDADTITIANHLTIGGTQSTEIYRFQVRLNGVDSPEIKSKNATTKELAKKARDALSNMIFWKIVELKNVKLEKYGRLLADVYLGDLHLNQWLIDNNYAVRYDGGTKQIPDEWEA